MGETNDADPNPSQTHPSRSDILQVYLKVIDYKRSVGVTQWAVLSIFAAASALVFSVGLKEGPAWNSRCSYVLGVMVYWLGFFAFTADVIHHRWRSLRCPHQGEFGFPLGPGQGAMPTSRQFLQAVNLA